MDFNDKLHKIFKELNEGTSQPLKSIFKTNNKSEADKTIDRLSDALDNAESALHDISNPPASASSTAAMDNLLSSPARCGVIGTTGAGKTWYMYGMYHQFVSTEWSITFQDDNQMAEFDRFHQTVSKGFGSTLTGTELSDFKEVNFSLKHGLNDHVINFEWVDYAGGIISDPTAGEKTNASVNHAIFNSNILFAFIDGDDMSGNDLGSIINRVRVKHSSYVMQKLGQFTDYNRNLVPIVFIITKKDRISIKENQISHVIKESFAPVFATENTPFYIIDVTAFKTNDQTRDFAASIDTLRYDPENMELPVLIGTAHTLSDYIKRLRASKDKRAANKTKQLARIVEHLSARNIQPFYNQRTVTVKEIFKDCLEPAAQMGEDTWLKR